MSCVAVREYNARKRMYAHSASIYKFNRKAIIKNMARKPFKYSSIVDIRRERRKEVRKTESEEKES